MIGLSVVVGGVLAAGGHLATSTTAGEPAPDAATLAAASSGLGGGLPGEPAAPAPAPASTTSTPASSTTDVPAPPSSAAPATTPSSTSTTTDVQESSETATPKRRATGGSQTEQVLRLVNAERAGAGCEPVEADSRLVTAAQGHSEDMSENDYFSHTSQDGRTFGDRITEAGYPSPGAENIAKGQRSAEQVMESWMSSPGHRRNILDCSLTALGTGLATDGWYWTQNFGR
ncbi:serine protease [Amycolatopsis antarctica]|uniref:Serine protease n=1 Tax=Amycolatopsis antarctica TaxID=1854586 RepID=A0A263D5K6_9PSEU|nr:CAP domain-containing protein [Amycolatopsis antarctica]OZM72756.1 serine protease [Amycolatopsis antarctica]